MKCVTVDNVFCRIRFTEDYSASGLLKKKILIPESAVVGRIMVNIVSHGYGFVNRINGLMNKLSSSSVNF